MFASYSREISDPPERDHAAPKDGIAQNAPSWSSCSDRLWANWRPKGARSLSATMMNCTPESSSPLLLTPFSAVPTAVKDDAFLETSFEVALLSIAGGVQPNCHNVVSPRFTTICEGANQSCSCRKSAKSSRKRVNQNGLPA